MERYDEGDPRMASILLNLEKLLGLKKAVCQGLINLGRGELASRITTSVGLPTYGPLGLAEQIPRQNMPTEIR